MWIDYKVTGDILDELNEYINEFLEEINRLKELKEKEMQEVEKFITNPEFQPYIKLYNALEDRIVEWEGKTENKGISDYCGKAIKKIVEDLNIKSELIYDKTDYQELDGLLYFFDIKIKHLHRKSVRINNWHFLNLMTLLDNFLVNNARLLYGKLCTINEAKKDEKLIKFGGKSLAQKMIWFKSVNSNIDYSNDRLVVLNAKRNAIVHSSAIVSNRILENIPIEIQQNNNLKVGMKIEFQDNEITEIFDELGILGQNIFKNISEKFIMTFEERGYDFKEELSKVKISEWL